MKYVVYPNTNIDRLPRDLGAVHLARPIKVKSLVKLFKKPKLTEISLSKSCAKRLSRKFKKMVREKGITLKEQSFRGRAIEIDMSLLPKLAEMRKDDRSYRKIEANTSIPKSTVHYLMKYADRTKIKKGKNIIYLQ